MSLTPALRVLSSPIHATWIITVVVVLVIAWSPAAKVVGAYTDVISVGSALCGAWGMDKASNGAALTKGRKTQLRSRG
ncbi:hypothetical protein [Peterkaempfera griseoplana]|uniref:hypothetical protein n=1 Tax=Peterkaempfera griseoplana TaxID=66896 RepID=UPI0006E28D33|nr:hypothetical protein [Peterkaempfera griseoplana]